jgi:hypothetical protein
VAASIELRADHSLVDLPNFGMRRLSNDSGFRRRLSDEARASVQEAHEIFLLPLLDQLAM